MPIDNIFKLNEGKLVKVNRFNLEPSKPSNSFSNTITKPKDFTVIAHPIVASMGINPMVILPFIPIEEFPVVETPSEITEKTIFKTYKNEVLNFNFPEIKLGPLNKNVFYYEPISDLTGKNIGFIGTVNLAFNLLNKNTAPNQRIVPISLKEVILNLKAKNEKTNLLENIKITGEIFNNEIKFKIKDEAVKIAFFNLASSFQELNCSIDLFFEFKGFSKIRKKIFFANDSFMQSDLLKIQPNISKPQISKFNNILLVSKRDTPKSLIKSIQKEQKVESNKQDDFIKSTFILRVSKPLSFPLGSDINTSVYKTIEGNFINNPFNLNTYYSEFQQIFVPGINFQELAIYKSKMQPNTFLLISKKYCITRTNDTLKPCISTIFHAEENENGDTQSISKIDFIFAIGPNLTSFDLQRLKIKLSQNNFLDECNNIFEDTNFIFPNNLNAEFEISGNQYLNTANVSADGENSYVLNISIERLNDASIIINSLNNAISQYANIIFKHKEIRDTSIIDINLQNTLGEILTNIITPTNIEVENRSLSSCKLKNIMITSIDNKFTIINDPFKDMPFLASQTKATQDLKNKLPLGFPNTTLKAFFDFESIEDVSLEFNQVVSQSTNYNRYIQITISPQDTIVSKVLIDLMVKDTSCQFNFQRMKVDFKTPFLFNFLLLNDTKNSTEIIYSVTLLDNNDVILKETKNLIFDFSKSSNLKI